ncbi:MAG: ATP-binding protein [Bacilli bacterium]
MELKEIERSIIKKYRKVIFAPFIKALKEFDLVCDNDKIAICISGGKDSFLLAKCMQELKKHGRVNFDLEFILMNPGYNEENLNQLKDNLKILGIDAHIFETPIFKLADATSNPCYMCAKMRRGYLYNYAKKLGCNKIALGHHFNDVVETVLLNMIFNGSYSSMMPKLKSQNFIDMELIRPLYYVKEEDIIKWAKSNDLFFLDCACSVTKKDAGKRKIMKNLVKELNKIYDKADVNILTSTNNVNLNTITGYKKDGNFYNFKDKY